MVEELKTMLDLLAQVRAAIQEHLDRIPQGNSGLSAPEWPKEGIELKEILFSFETDKGYSAFVARCCCCVTAFARLAG
jgi:hypothetical protein